MEDGFEVLGISKTEDGLYRSLLNHPGASAPQLAERVGVSSRAARQGLERLERLGLVSTNTESTGEYVPASPSVALEALVSRREEELRHVRLEAARLTEQFAQRVHDSQARSPVEFVRGAEATYQRWAQVQLSAKEGIRMLDQPPYFSVPMQPNPHERALLSAGVRHRVIYDHASFEVDGKLDAAVTSMSAGEEARVMRDVPFKLLVADDSFALIHSPSPAPVNEAFIVHRSALLHALIILFEALWERATSISQLGEPGPAGTVTIDTVDQQIVTFLCAGLKDEAIARRLGIGLRTVRRRVGLLMKRLDADTRFEAGFRAAKLGLIE